MGRPRNPVSQWHALKAWGTQGPAYSVFPSEFSISSCPQHISPIFPNCSVGLKTMCVISLFSGLFDILRPQSSLKFHPRQVSIPTWPLSHLFCQNLKMSLMSFLTSSLWDFSSRLFSVFPSPCQPFPVFNIRAVPLATPEYKLPTKNLSN